MKFYLGPERRRIPRQAIDATGALRIVCFRMWWLIAYSDTTPTRFMLALTASLWALLLAWPGDTMTRPVYRYLAMVAGDQAEYKWMLFWALHAAGMWWRVLSATPRPVFAFFIHVLGVVLFTSTAIGIFLTLTYPIPAAIAPDIVLALASVWVLVRTHINSEIGWRND